ncbi:hypothetical protein N44_02890 [Microcystis aeruginosa NIES-44]|uniref:Uncharacterized protein n=1 Tax=Microcystis aeruginosa NIES-44 TaxID=449439 RepID=A0A0A1VX44_MICAE|nr:hypothetical protein N44_02890 [Microcystis aeruginosa NIES-44]
MDAVSIIAIGDDHIVSKAVKPSCFWGYKLFICADEEETILIFIN